MKKTTNQHQAVLERELRLINQQILLINRTLEEYKCFISNVEKRLTAIETMLGNIHPGANYKMDFRITKLKTALKQTLHVLQGGGL